MVKTAILGFGNPCRSDDAIGIYVIEALKEVFQHREDITVVDMGTGAFEVLFKLKGHQRIILVDGVINSGEPVGSLFQVPAAEVLRAPVDDPLVFLHSIKWDQALSYAKKILQDEYPEDIEVYLVAIEDTKLAMQLSDTVKTAGDRLISIITEKFLTEAV
jgi:hydrogenase maturation protease